MGTVVVDVMLKPEIADPQGQAVTEALHAAGYTQFGEVRQGRRFALAVDGPVTPAVLEQARKAAEAALVSPATEVVIAVRDGVDAAVVHDFDWDDDELERWGAIAPIPEGAGQHEGRRTVKRPELDADRLNGVEGVAVYDADDDR